MSGSFTADLDNAVVMHPLAPGDYRKAQISVAETALAQGWSHDQLKEALEALGLAGDDD